MTSPAGYNARKAAQVIAYFARKTRNSRLNILKAAKLVYLADRECLSRFGYPIIDDYRVSMPHGPVNSITYSFMNGECEDSDWSAILRDRANHELSVRKEAEIDGWDELSDAELSCLDKVWERFGHFDQWQIRDWTHDKKNVPEWEDPSGSSRPIPLNRILEMLSVENATDHAANLDDLRSAGRLLDTLKAQG